MEITNQIKKYVKSLHANKHRQKYNKFIAEGPKICSEFLTANKYTVEYLFCTVDWSNENFNLLEGIEKTKVFIIKERALAQISLLKTSNKVLLVLDQRHSGFPDNIPTGWSLYMDQIQDPGNMGAILRIADWYGIINVQASPDSVHFFNPKVVQAAMGAHNRVELTVLSKEHFILMENTEKYGLSLNGIALNNKSKFHPGTIVIGNESQGISKEVISACSQQITIPRIGGAESLNASVACGIACQLLVGE